MKKIENATIKWKAKKVKLREQGLTLVALVVTIIILLILTGVTLNIALSDNGLFDKTQEAVDKYKKAEQNEEDALNKLSEKLENINIDYNDYIGAYVDYTPKNTKECIIESTTSGVKKNTDSNGNTIGDNVLENGNQTFTTETDIKWRIWDYDGRIIRLISDKPTNLNLTLEGVTGYNNGVWAINEICRKCYGQYEEDKITEKNGIKVANLKRSDIQKISNYDYTNYRHEPSTWVEFTGENEEGKTLIQYGETKTYEKNNQVPKIWNEHDAKWTYLYNKDDKTKSGKNADGEDPWEKEFEYTNESGIEEAKNNIPFKQSYYMHEYINKEVEFKDRRYYDLIFKDGKRRIYWILLACRSLYTFVRK